MKSLQASLQDRPPYNKFLILVGITLISAVLFTAMAVGLCQAIWGVNLAGQNLLQDGNSNPDIISSFRFFQAMTAIGTFVLPSFLAAYLFSGNSAAYLGLDKKAKIPSLLMVVLLLLIAIPFINWMIMVNGDMHLPASMKAMEDWMKNAEEQAASTIKILLGSPSVSGLIINLFVIAIIPAIGEELLFRGVIQKEFSALANNKHVAIVLTAVLFSALHMQFYGFFPRFALGVLLGYIYLWSGTLWLPILAHFINNAGAVILTWYTTTRAPGINPDTIGTEPGQENILALSVFMTLAGIWLLRKQLVKNTN